ncbi:MAG: pyroglutamyl-peptidase [Planctomycetota bacterium]|jgi:pyroglutamyl-peptidase
MRHLTLLIMGSALAGADTIVVTGFAPFAGRGVNGSETIARRLDGAVIAGATVAVRILPVRWGVPEQTLPGLAANRPRLLLGLGEGHPGRIAVELVGRNRAGHPDEAGVPPPARLGDGPAERDARFAFEPAAFATSPVPVVASRDAGAYLCNAWLWHAAALPVPAVGFVHLPPQGETPDAAYAAPIEPVIRALIARQLASATSPVPAPAGPGAGTR